MRKRSRLSILAGLSAATGVKVSLLEALDRIEADPDFAQATYATETRRRTTALARRRMGRCVAKRWRLRRLTRIRLSRSTISSAVLRNRQSASVA
jgi:hypothetical protein